ncbi:CvpA family protein [Litorilinea aerophila]|uniref:CvpA family protein n=1 Tax=Litorilinea aerophila TaxID=1204385 RepID=A0A540VGN1_9CHLR|nr:CvpA family protein [Litorilinea aerophila]MCC9076533.1 CvpA family protein [Litorilinea aerophila]GIV79558.1 MAG: hypothetical protein KatS3mg050_3952 [Litorilinea sp.]
MGPIEVIFFTIGLIVALIGVTRGYAKELGSTVLILVGIVVLDFLEDRIDNVLAAAGAQLLGSDNPEGVRFFQFLVLSLLFIAIVYAGYSGRTLEFSGRPAPPPQGTLLSILVGLFNGYLIAGMLWYFLHKYDYPVQALGWMTSTELSPTAQTLVNYLPLTLFSAPYWMALLGLLLILRVRG